MTFRLVLMESEMASYPVYFSVARPARFDRVQIALRVVLLALLSCVGLTMGVIFSALYLALPVVAAVMLSQGGPSRFLADGAPRISRGLRWVMSAYAYISLLTDRLPGGEPGGSVSFAIEPGSWSTLEGSANGPSAKTALLRLLYSIPSALILGILTVMAWFVWLVAALLIVLTETYPEGLYDFQCGVLRWQARLFAYQASLVEAYPPFSLDVGPDADARGPGSPKAIPTDTNVHSTP
jgi:hypothetical protein